MQRSVSVLLGEERSLARRRRVRSLVRRVDVRDLRMARRSACSVDGCGRGGGGLSVVGVDAGGLVKVGSGGMFVVCACASSMLQSVVVLPRQKAKDQVGCYVQEHSSSR